MNLVYQSYDGETFETAEACYLYEFALLISKEEDFRTAAEPLVDGFVSVHSKNQFLRELAMALPQLVEIRNQVKAKVLAENSNLDKVLSDAHKAVASITAMSKILGDEEF